MSKTPLPELSHSCGWGDWLCQYKACCVHRLRLCFLCSVSCLTPLLGGISKCYLMPFKFKEFQSLIFRSAPLSIDLVPGWLPRLFSGSSSDVPNWMEISQEHLNLGDYHKFLPTNLGKFLPFGLRRVL